MNFTFIGDVHGEFEEYFKIVNLLENDSIQLGDMGIGFPTTPQGYNESFGWDNHNFIRGNHDNPEVCRKHKNYLGDYGITKEGIFFVSGAHSIDKDFRTPMIDWWPDEELSAIAFNLCLDLYEKEKPDLVISHSCPTELLEYTSSFNLIISSNTSSCLSEMLRIHKPREWIFGHMHSNWSGEVLGVNFCCVDSLIPYTIEM